MQFVAVHFKTAPLDGLSIHPNKNMLLMICTLRFLIYLAHFRAVEDRHHVRLFFALRSLSVKRERKAEEK